MKVAVFNLGCKVNQYECDVICEKLAKNGYETSQELCCADFYIINTCAVTGEAERKSRQAIARCRALNPSAKVLVCGCAAQKEPQAFEKEGVTYVSGVADKLGVIENLCKSELTVDVAALPLKYESMSLNTPHRTRAYVKIQDGCNNFCSYCIIPYLRGRSRSREINEIVEEIKILAPQTHEIVLTGIDLMAYGKDLGYNLTDLMKRLSDVDTRIRLGSVYAEAINEDFLDSLYSLKHFCPHYHLSLQSGDNSVLKSMNRHYTAEIYREKIDLIRSYDANAAITTDVIIAYPTETDEAFANTCEFVEDAKFSDIHIFPYSSRSGTKAASLPQINGEIVKERKRILSNIKSRLHNAYLMSNIGIPQEVLIEEEIDGYNVGYSKNYIRVYTKKKGDTVTVIPERLYKDGLTEE